MYLLIGYERDPWCGRVAAALRARGHAVLTTPNPLADERLFAWALDSTSSSSSLRWPGGSVLGEDTLRGVFVRTPGGPGGSEGWSPEDLAYVQAEMNAALVAWLRALPCPVLNRPTADLWFRPARSLPEWRAHFQAAGLPALAAQVTNDLAAAQAFAARWGGGAVYAPLTSPTRYPVADDDQWQRLAGLMERIPVCLVEPTAGPPAYATLVGGRIVWGAAAEVREGERAALAGGLLRLAALLEAGLLQVELRRGAGGLRCSGVHLFPLLDAHSPAEQDAIVAGVVELLAA